MKVLAVELYRCELNLVRPTATSAGTQHRRPVVLLRLITDEAVGWGECAALAAPSYSAEYADGAERVLAEHLVPLLLGAGERLEGAASVAGLLAPVRGHEMAKAAIEMAVLDAELRASDESLAQRIGALASSVVAGATVGLGTPDEVVAAVAEAVEAGITRVKCKIGPGHDLGLLRAVRAAFPDLGLTADANGAYDVEIAADRRALGLLDELDLSALEQPLAPDDLVGHARLAAELRTPVLLDESVASAGALESAIALGAADGVAVKPARLGGVLAACRVHDRCRAAGLHLSIGGMFETGLGRAVSLAVAALPGFDLAGDVGPSSRYFSRDLTLPHELRAGMLAVPSGPGIGVEPLAEVLAATQLRATTWPTR